MSYRIIVPPSGSSSGNCVTQWRRSSLEANFHHHRLSSSLIWRQRPPLVFLLANLQDIFVVSRPVINLLQQTTALHHQQLPLFLCVFIPVLHQEPQVHMERHQNYPPQYR
ncbi:hypothetical protein DMENIID0001_109050 [Sergentomyia squamirostris]